MFKVVDENDYKNIVQEIGSYQYHIYDQGELMPGSIFGKIVKLKNYNCVLAGTSVTATAYTIEGDYQDKITVPARAQIVVVRLLRYDTTHGEPHYNADDQLIFPAKSGDIYRFSRKDAPDHYLGISGDAKILSIADAYKLPIDKSGPVVKYSERGAELHVDLLPDGK